MTPATPAPEPLRAVVARLGGPQWAVPALLMPVPSAARAMSAAAPAIFASAADDAAAERPPAAVLEQLRRRGGVHLSRRVEGRSRWYRLSLQRSLFGTVDVVAEWGSSHRQQLHPHRQLVACAGSAEALTMLRGRLAQKWQRGYRPYGSMASSGPE